MEFFKWSIYFLSNWRICPWNWRANSWKSLFVPSATKTCHNFFFKMSIIVFNFLRLTDWPQIGSRTKFERLFLSFVTLTSGQQNLHDQLQDPRIYGEQWEWISCFFHPQSLIEALDWIFTNKNIKNSEFYRQDLMGKKKRNGGILFIPGWIL